MQAYVVFVMALVAVLVTMTVISDAVPVVRRAAANDPKPQNDIVKKPSAAGKPRQPKPDQASKQLQAYTAGLEPSFYFDVDAKRHKHPTSECAPTPPPPASVVTPAIAEKVRKACANPASVQYGDSLCPWVVLHSTDYDRRPQIIAEAYRCNATCRLPDGDDDGNNASLELMTRCEPVRYRIPVVTKPASKKQRAGSGKAAGGDGKKEPHHCKTSRVIAVGFTCTVIRDLKF